MLCFGVITRFINSIMKVDSPKKQMLDINMILSWVDDDVDKNYIDKASVKEVINILFAYE